MMLSVYRFGIALVLSALGINLLEGTTNITLNSPSVNVTDGATVCPGIFVSLICEAIGTGADVTTLTWNLIATKIGKNITVTQTSTMMETEFYTLMNTFPQGRIISQLNISISVLRMKGDRISCESNGVTSEVLMIDYTLRGPPRSIANFFTTQLSNETGPNSRGIVVTFIWNDTYNTEYNISAYEIEKVDTTVRMIECQSSCSLTDTVPCECIKLPSRQTFFRITPKNCENQAGQSTTVASSCNAGDLGDPEIEPVAPMRCQSNTSAIGINNGIGCFMGDTIGLIANFVCNDGYSPLGSLERRCLYNGRWSGTPTKCTSLTQASIGLLVTCMIFLIPIFIIVVTLSILHILSCIKKGAECYKYFYIDQSRAHFWTLCEGRLSIKCFALILYVAYATSAGVSLIFVFAFIGSAATDKPDHRTVTALIAIAFLVVFVSTACALALIIVTILIATDSGDPSAHE